MALTKPLSETDNEMRRMQTAFLGLFLFGCLTVGSISFAADPVRLAFSSFSATNAGFFTAIEEKIFERRGIDLTYVYIASSSVVMPAVLTREVDLATLSGEIVVRAYHQGAKNMAIVGTQLDKFTFSLYTKPEIKTPQDLRGKILGVSRFGGSLDISLRYGLQQVGLDSKRDNITVVQAGGMPEIMAGLTAGKLDGAMLLSVYAQRGKELGFRELLDLGTLGVSFPQGVTLTTREFLRDKAGFGQTIHGGLSRRPGDFSQKPARWQKGVGEIHRRQRGKISRRRLQPVHGKISEQVDGDRTAHALDRLRSNRRRSGR